MRIATKNCKLDCGKLTKQKIYSKIAIIIVYKLDKSKDTLNAATMRPL